MSKEWAYMPGDHWVICSKCKEQKDASAFYKCSAAKNGLQSACKKCTDSSRSPRDPKYVLEKQKRYRESHREEMRKRNTNWRKNNLEYDAYRASCYRARKLQRTPPWANLEEIKRIYLDCPKGYHVDHIIPLKGKTVSGLHVESNLQYLPAIDNIKKRNIYE